MKNNNVAVTGHLSSHQPTQRSPPRWWDRGGRHSSSHLTRLSMIVLPVPPWDTLIRVDSIFYGACSASIIKTNKNDAEWFGGSRDSMVVSIRKIQDNRYPYRSARWIIIFMLRSFIFSFTYIILFSAVKSYW